MSFKQELGSKEFFGKEKSLKMIGVLVVAHKQRKTIGLPQKIFVPLFLKKKFQIYIFRVFCIKLYCTSHTVEGNNFE